MKEEKESASHETIRTDAINHVATHSIDSLTIRAYENRKLMGTDAAKLVHQRINELLNQQDYVNIIFAAAPSQNEFLSALTQNTSIEWKRVNAFHMDEYTGLPENDPRTFAAFLKEKIFNCLPFCQVNYINGNANNIENECKRYAELLIKYPPDIVCMGIGENGHIAFNDPHVADFNDPVKVKMVSLDTECRQQQVNDGCFNVIDQVPTDALTLTIPALLAGRYIYCIVPGEKKAKAVYNTLFGDLIEKYPSTILRRHPDAVLFLDRGSSSLL
jgi:glucosamine-6-phosphate deaminase